MSKSNKSSKSPKKTKKPLIAKKKKEKKESMKEKLEIKQTNSNDKASRIVGTIFIGLGILLVAFGIYSFIKFKAEPTFNEALEIPTMEYVTDLTNQTVIEVKGTATNLDSVALYVNDERVDETKVKKDDTYEFVYDVDGEGEYSISVAGLKGFPFREIGTRSASVIAMVDMTAPSIDDVKLVYKEETSNSTFKLSGTVEANSVVKLTRGVNEYTATADENGDFVIEGVALDEGKNVFYISLTDEAGNTVSLDEKVRIAYSPDADLNGDGAVSGTTDDQLPQADGDLDNLLIRNLMIIFGLAALFVFSGSSIYAFNRKK
ncbi:MAG: Ig-like domain-containing protein [Candidatus Dojkabacteria bacterium]|nr:Ig-like domain-containing protein [Candidatus Dojkabacteria bacterium]